MEGEMTFLTVYLSLWRSVSTEIKMSIINISVRFI